MAAKSQVNTKFVLILIVALGAVGVGLGAVWYYQASQDATRHIVNAEQFIKDGNHDAALKEFGRAVNKAPTEMRYVHMMDALVLSMKPTTQDRMEELHNTHIGLLKREADYRLDDPTAHLKYIEELHLCARFGPDPRLWEQLLDAAQDMDKNLPESAPDRIKARLYRGMASMQTRQQLEDATIAAAQEDIRSYLSDAPNDDLAWGTLVLSELQFYENLRSRAESRRAADQLAKVDATLAEALQAVPEGLNVLRTQLLRLSVDDTDPEAQAAIQEGLKRLAQLASVSDDPLMLGDTVQLLRGMGGKEGIVQAIAILEPYLAAHPDRIDLRVQLAEAQLQAGSVDASEAAAQAVLEHEPLPVSYLARFQNFLHQRAAALLVDAAFQRWETADESARPGLLEGIQSARDRVASLVSNQETNAAMMRADGKLAFAMGHYDKAATKFEEILKSTAGQRNLEAMVFSAQSLERTGQAGIALDRLKAALSLQPRNRTLLLERARMEGVLRRYPEAMATLETILRLEPGHARATEMSQAYARIVQQGGVAVAENDPVVVLIREAEAREQQGEVDAARQSLLAGLQQHADNLALLASLARLEMKAGRTPEAMAFAERGLDVAPQNEWFRQIKVTLAYPDPVERIEAYAALVEGDDRERAAGQYVHLINVAKVQEDLAAQHEADWNPEELQKAKEIAGRARTRAEVHRQNAMKDGVDHPSVLNHTFLQALAAKDWATAEAAVDGLAAADADQAGGLVLRGQLDLARAHYVEAVRTLTQAVERKGHSSQPWRLLALAYVLLGNNAEAQRAFEEAYSRNPNDLELVKLYVDLLLRMGERASALRVVREARPLAGNDRAFRELWLTLEGDVGDRAAAVRTRAETYVRNPSDRVNAARLATMLVKSQPTFEAIIDERGAQRYDAVSWSRVPTDVQKRMLEDLRAKWRGESAAILDSFGSDTSSDFELTQVRASLLATHGRIAEAEAVYRQFIQAQNPAQMDTKVFIAFAEFQKSIGRGEAALQTLDQARAHQRGDDRSADKALADSLMLAGQYEQAIEAYRRVLSVGAQPSVDLNIAEALIRLGRTDEARTQIQQVIDGSGATLSAPQRLVTELLQAQLLEAEGNALYAEGQAGAAEGKFTEQRRVLEEAQRRVLEDAQRRGIDEAQPLEQVNPVPSIHRAQSLLAAFKRTGQANYLDEALLALDQAETLRVNFPAISAVRADVHLARGDVRRAIIELERTLLLQPENTAARQTLVMLHLRDNNNVDGAIGVMRAAIELNPTIPAWHEQIGDLYVAKADYALAIASFTTAYEIDPRKAMLRKLALAMLSSAAPPYPRVLQLLTADKDSLNDPVLRAFYALTLNGMDQREEAVAQLHRAYREQRAVVVAGGNAADWNAWFFSARKFFTANQPSAIESLVMELSEGKPNPEELYQLALVWRDSGRDGLQRALELQRQVVAQCPPGNPKLLADLNFVLSRYAIVTGDFASAAAALEVVVREQPDYAVALNDLAYLLAEELGEPQRALPFAEKAVLLNPRHASMLDTLGVVYHRLGRENEAEERLGQSLAIEPSAETHKHLAEVLIALGRPADAERQLLRALELKPSADVQQEINRLLDDMKAGKK